MLFSSQFRFNCITITRAIGQESDNFLILIWEFIENGPGARKRRIWLTNLQIDLAIEEKGKSKRIFKDNGLRNSSNFHLHQLPPSRVFLLFYSRV